MKKLALAILLVAFVAMPAFAAVQSVKVGVDIDSTYLYRQNFDLGDNNDTQYQSLFITQSILRIDGDLTEKVAATLALINERVWNATLTSASTDIDLYLAFLKLQEVLESNLTLIIGRQDFRYGNSFIFDSAGTNNVAPGDSGLLAVANDLTKQTALDAIRAILDYDPLTIDLVFAVAGPGSTTFTNVDTSNYIYGTNLNYQVGDDMNTELESYLWYQVDKSSNTTTGAKADITKVIGLRFSTNPTERFNVQGEFARQSGTDHVSGATNHRRNAYGMQGIVNYRLPVMEEYNPVAQYVFTKVTGDDDSDDDQTGWNPFFESQGGGTIYNTLFNLTNAVIHTASLSVNPMEDVMAKLSLTGIWLQRELKGSSLSLRQPDDSGTATEVVDVKSDKRHLGKEVDFELTYDYTEDVQFGLLLGYFFPGSVFNVTGGNNDVTAKQILFNVDVNF